MKVIATSQICINDFHKTGYNTQKGTTPTDEKAGQILIIEDIYLIFIGCNDIKSH